MTKRARKIFATLLIVLFASYYCETTFFAHTHTFYWGTVTHSHPYKSTSHHTHNEVELQTIAVLNLIIVTGITLGVALMPVNRTVIVRHRDQAIPRVIGHQRNHDTRGSPFIQ